MTGVSTQVRAGSRWGGIRRAPSTGVGEVGTLGLPSRPQPGSRPRVLRLLALGFVVTLFFENLVWVDRPFRILPSTFVGFALGAAFAFRGMRRMSFVRGASAWFFAFLVVTAIEEVVRYQVGALPAFYSIPSYRAYFQFAQSVLLYLIFQDVLHDARVARTLARVFLGCVGGMAVASLFVTVGGTVLSDVSRIGFGTLNVNTQGYLYAMTIVALVCRLLDRWPAFGRGEAFVVGLVGVMTLALARTGSRVSTVALLVGLATAASLNLRRRQLSAYFLLVPVMAAGMGAIVLTTPVVEARWTAVVEQGDTGTRAELADSGLGLFGLSPILGRGASYMDELGGLVLGQDRPIAAHNAYLEVLVSFGIIGAIPWLLGIASVFGGVWRRRKQLWGTVFSALLAASLVYGLAGNLGYDKFFWILLAMATRVVVFNSSETEREMRRPQKVFHGRDVGSAGRPSRHGTNLRQPVRVPSKS